MPENKEIWFYLCDLWRGFWLAVFFSERRKRIRAAKKEEFERGRTLGDANQVPNEPPNPGQSNVGDEVVLINRDKYYEDLRGRDEAAALRTFEFVARTREFEINLYWKRATYFWAFLAVTFAGYVAILRTDMKNSFIALAILAVGVVLSFAWHFSNLGSKAWQRHWEKHLDLLEDDFVGPLYKTISTKQTFSVSKINEIVSFFFILVWNSLLVRHLHSQYSFTLYNPDPVLTMKIGLFLTAMIMTFVAMVWGKGRGRFRAQEIKMYRRGYKHD